MVDIEICLNAEIPARTRAAASAAYEGGAARIELCRDMHLDGLTPVLACMRTARDAFVERPGLVVMIRPRGGDFCYTRRELARLLVGIDHAAQAGANGIALGVLRGDFRIDTAALERLMRAALDAGVHVTFHRAFDAVPDADEALETLAALGVQRVLTAGISWGAKGSALDGLPRLRRTLELVRGRLEVVVAGGVNPGNAGFLCSGLAEVGGEFSLHAYSGAQEYGVTTLAAVKAFVQAAKAGGNSQNTKRTSDYRVQ